MIGAVTDDAAAATGLRAGTPVVGGGGDQAANAVGVGAVRAGIGGAVARHRRASSSCRPPGPAIEPDGLLHAFCHSVPGTWHLMGVMLSAAGSRCAGCATRWRRAARSTSSWRSPRSCRPAATGSSSCRTSRRADAPSRPAGARRLRGPHRPPRPRAPRAGGPRGRGVQPARRLRARARDLARAAARPARVRWRHEQPAVAPDHRRRPGRADVSTRHGRGRRQRRGHPRRGRRPAGTRRSRRPARPWSRSPAGRSPARTPAPTSRRTPSTATSTRRCGLVRRSRRGVGRDDRNARRASATAEEWSLSTRWAILTSAVHAWLPCRGGSLLVECRPGRPWPGTRALTSRRQPCRPEMGRAASILVHRGGEQGASPVVEGPVDGLMRYPAPCQRHRRHHRTRYREVRRGPCAAARYRPSSSARSAKVRTSIWQAHR